MTTIDIQTCGCVKAARQLSTAFHIQSKYITDGSATSSSMDLALGSFMVKCGYCSTILYTAYGLDLAKPVELRESCRIGLDLR